MKITHDETRCIGSGMCESLAPDFFEVAEDGSLIVKQRDVPESARAEVELAVTSCPVEALGLTD